MRISRLAEGSRLRQALKMTKAHNFADWRAAMSELNLQMFNTVLRRPRGQYLLRLQRRHSEARRKLRLDQAGRRQRPAHRVAGELHSFDELPQMLNPASGFVQNCNSTPFFTTDDGNPVDRRFSRLHGRRPL